MECDFKKMWPYFLKAAASRGVAEMWREDCAAECAVRIWQAQESANFATVVIRAVQDFQRKFGRWNRYGHRERAQMNSIEYIASLPKGNHFLEKHARHELTPERIYCCQESLQEVDTLPERSRRMLLMYAMGFTFLEIGTMASISESMTCQIVNRARNTLREACAVVE